MGFPGKPPVEILRVGDAPGSGGKTDEVLLAQSKHLERLHGPDRDILVIEDYEAVAVGGPAIGLADR